VAQFINDLGAFLRKWQLMQLSTWDLPVPQGPLNSVTLALAAHLLGPDQLVNTVPTYYDIPSGTDVRSDIRSMQREDARSAVIDPAHPVSDIGPRDGHGSSWENAFRLWLIEETVQQRYGRPRGLVPRLISAFATMLDCSAERIEQLRKLYKPFLSAALGG